jgi:glycosyltransferase involved in cell wall biosynthesis
LSLISIILPTYNRKASISEALESIYAQSYRNYEIIVIDDGSTDGTSISISSMHPNVRLLTLSKNKGAANARNKGIDVANGDVLAFLDSDDLWAPDYLLSQISYLQSNTDASAVFSSHSKSDENNNNINISHKWPIENPQLQLVINKNFIHTMSLFMVRKNPFLKTGKLKVELAICHDRDFYIRFLESYNIAYNRRNLVIRRYSDNQVTHDIKKWYKEAKSIIAPYFKVHTDKKNLKHVGYCYLNESFLERTKTRKDLSFLRIRWRAALLWHKYLANLTQRTQSISRY